MNRNVSNIAPFIGPVDIEAALERLGFQVIYEGGMGRIIAMLLKTPLGNTIYINEDTPEQEVRVELAHGLGHLLAGDSLFDMNLLESALKGELVMPTEHLKEDERANAIMRSLLIPRGVLDLIPDATPEEISSLLDVPLFIAEDRVREIKVSAA